MTDLVTPASDDTRAGLDMGTYEVLRARLGEQAEELARRAETLNAARLKVFGGAELALLGTERIHTAAACVPRDIVPLGSFLLFGANPARGLGSETRVSDVFSLHRFSSGDGTPSLVTAAPGDLPGLVDDTRFRRDFAEMYRYFRNTRLLQLRRVEGLLLAVFQTGPTVSDVRVLRWRIGADGSVTYVDNKGERDHVLPPQQDVTWVQTTRDDHVLGRHPHISVDGEVFVSTVGGTLTVKVDNDTETRDGIYSEPVAERLQSLADADVSYARIGSLLLLRILPYKETEHRHLVFNTRTKTVVRLDGIGQACQRLPDDQGIIFPGGYYLATGAVKTFDTDVSGLEFLSLVRSPNGEDVLYVFHSRAEGRSLLLPYNTIRKEVATPISCHGHAVFDDGTMVVFRALDDEPTRVHPLQVWRTPFQSDTYAARQPTGTGPLERVGNADLVRGISDALAVTRMVREMAPSGPVFDGLIAACTRILDQHYWLSDPELENLAEPLTQVRATAEQVVDEFAKVQELTAQARRALDETEADITALVRRIRAEVPTSADEWVRSLAEMRRARGRAETLRDLRYVDTARLDALIDTLESATADAGRRAVEFLSGADAFADYHSAVAALAAEAETIATVADAEPVQRRLAEQTDGLETVTEVVGSLEAADATVRTRILEQAAEVLATINRARAIVDARRRELLSAERKAEFAAEFALLEQSVAGALAAADTPEACDEQLGRLLLRVDGLTSRFAEFSDFLAQLETKRDDIYEALHARKQALVDERMRRADRLVESAERILASVRRRAATFGSLDEVTTFFTSDPMVAKLRSLAEELRELGDQVRAEEVDGQVAAARQEAGRALRDRQDLFADDGTTIQLGRHRFAVNTQPLELTMVPHEGRMAYVITGTDYRSWVTDPDFEKTRPFWDQPLVSESPDVYRAEYLAAELLAAAEAGRNGLSLSALRKAAEDRDALLAVVRREAESRYDEGYERGVHDHDAAAILAVLVRLVDRAGLLRYPGRCRAAAQMWWAYGTAAPDRQEWAARARSLVRARSLFGSGTADALAELAAELEEQVTVFLTTTGLDAYRDWAAGAGGYLVEELAASPEGFVTSPGARSLVDRFRDALGPDQDFTAELAALGSKVAARFRVVHAWLSAFAATREDVDTADLPEAVALLLADTLPRYPAEGALTAAVDGLLGVHPRIQERRLEVRLDEFLDRLRRFRTERVPAYRAYLRRRNELVAAERARLRLSEYQPRVLSSFVRNQLVDEVYLPLIGDNLAKQLGAAGSGKRTDQMGLLLLISPPGYGKTTLMEYVADRLGLLFVKVNGPSLGHAVTSLDPAEAPNATARQEVEKISFALEAGTNVLLYVDDIQHTSPELLQKFVSLCDGQRRMEGVWQGRTRTYDLRGKRFAVCMAGNPYTEDGKRFRVPDMLANRADVWNLGDVLSGRDDVFALSYVENALTSNPVLAPLSTRDRGDVRLLVRLARGEEGVRPDQLSHPYSKVELEQILSVLRTLLRVQEVVLAVNRAYIASAAQSDAARTEPPFLLQGSYRNMNAIAERIVPVMNDAEVEALIDDHYRGEAQALASGAEANLLKLAELRGRMTEEQRARWAEVKAAFQRAQALGGAEDSPINRAVGAVGLLADRVGAVEQAIDRAAQRLSSE